MRVPTAAGLRRLCICSPTSGSCLIPFVRQYEGTVIARATCSPTSGSWLIPSVRQYEGTVLARATCSPTSCWEVGFLCFAVFAPLTPLGASTRAPFGPF